MKIDTSNWIKGKNYYDWNDDISLSILSNGYLLPHEDIKIAFKRVSKAAARRLRKRELQPYFLEAMEKNWLCLASPVLSNMGTERGLPISCFTIHVDDSIEGIADANSELMRLASQGGGVGMYIGEIRGRGELIKDNGVSEGVVPWLKIYDSTTLATNQGSVRRGATAFYLDINHRDIEEFLMIRRPKGDINRQCLNSHHAVVITDEFMEAVENKNPEAQKLWAEILKTRLETGEPYMMFKDNVNKANPEGYKRLGLEVASSNICTEILLYTDPLHSFVCCLSSLNLARWDEWKDYKFENGMTLPELSCWFLEGVLQEFIDRAKNMKFMDNTVRSAKKGRAIGIGALGWHTFLQQKNLPFLSIASTAYRKQISEFIYEGALKASRDQAKEYGEPEWCKGTGKRNLTLLAIAPNRSSSKLAGGLSQGVEPIAANIYVDDDAKGLHIRRNPELVKLLESKDRNIPEVWDQIIEDKGSVVNVRCLSDEEKEVFKTFKEINQLELVNQAGIRQKYLDQGQSINIAFAQDAPAKFINLVHLRAWEVGLKSLYYFRSESNLRADSAQQRDLYSECVMCEG